MTDLISRDELTSSVVNRQAKIPDILPYRDVKAWLDGYTACQHDILDIVESAKPVALGTDHVVINWTPNLDKLARDVAYQALNEFRFMGKSIQEWAEIIMEHTTGKKRPGWIRVEERLPEEDGDYLVYAFGFIDRLRFADGVWWDYGAECQPGVVTHWMKLPEPPEDVQE